MREREVVSVDRKDPGEVLRPRAPEAGYMEGTEL